MPSSNHSPAPSQEEGPLRVNLLKKWRVRLRYLHELRESLQHRSGSVSDSGRSVHLSTKLLSPRGAPPSGVAESQPPLSEQKCCRRWDRRTLLLTSAFILAPPGLNLMPLALKSRARLKRRSATEEKLSQLFLKNYKRRAKPERATTRGTGTEQY